MIKINVGLNRIARNGSRKQIEHKNVTTTVEGEWRAEGFHAAVVDQMTKWYPEWTITGYALAEAERV